MLLTALTILARAIFNGKILVFAEKLYQNRHYWIAGKIRLSYDK